MLRWFLVLLLVQIISGALPTFFEPSTLCPEPDTTGYFGPAVAKLRIALDDFATLTKDTTIEDKPYVKLTSFHYLGNGLNSTLLKGVQIRIRGRAAQEFDKKSFTLKFKNSNITKLQLKAEATDPSFIREHLILDVHKSFGFCSQRKGFTQLWVNGTYWGLYTVLEDIGDEYIQARDASVGLLYKLNYNSLEYQGEPYFPVLGEPQRTHKKDIPTLAPVGNLVKALAQFTTPAEIQKVIDVYSMLKYLAIEVATRDWDNYWLKANNYYLYYNFTAGKLFYLPYDFDLTLGSVMQGEALAPFFYNISALDYSSTDFRQYYPRPLINNVLAHPTFRSYYYWCLSFAAKLIASPQFDQHARDLQAKIAPFVDEGNKSMSIWKSGSFNASLTSPTPLIQAVKSAMNAVDVFGLFPFNQKWSSNMTAQLATKNLEAAVITKVYSHPGGTDLPSLLLVVQLQPHKPQQGTSRTLSLPEGFSFRLVLVTDTLVGRHIDAKEPISIYAHIEHSFDPTTVQPIAHLTTFENFEPIPFKKAQQIPMPLVYSIGSTYIYRLDLELGNWNRMAYAVQLMDNFSPPDYPKSFNSLSRNS